ncbi:MAG: hypothetical protein KKB50_00700 [Planctomycetes bacterium]|nr:hypothetical protein [Planctomycetota bacterium]
MKLSIGGLFHAEPTASVGVCRKDDEDHVVDTRQTRIVELAGQYGCFGYRRVSGLPRAESWKVNHKRLERLWRRERLKMPSKQLAEYTRECLVIVVARGGAGQARGDGGRRPPANAGFLL